MEHLIEEATRGNVTEVKIVLATVALALAGHQVVLAALAQGWLRLPFLAGGAASWTHRAGGDAILGPTGAARLEKSRDRRREGSGGPG